MCFIGESRVKELPWSWAEMGNLLLDPKKCVIILAWPEFAFPLPSDGEKPEHCGLASRFPGLGSAAETRTTAETLNHVEICVVRRLGHHFRRLKIFFEVPSIT